jgi:hypothetical protein
MAILIVVGVLVVALVIAMIVAVARDSGPSPADVAIGYEHAWDRLDFEVVYKLSGDELHDGLNRGDYVAAKREAYHAQGQLGHLMAHAAVREETVVGDRARIYTRLTLRDGTTVENRVLLRRRHEDWVVVGYDLRSAAT